MALLNELWTNSGRILYFLFHPSPIACLGEKLEIYVTTPLSPDGSFWVQQASAEESEFVQMVERLQKEYEDSPPSPFFFSPGNICAAQFSEDHCWYRSRVEGVVKDKVGRGQGGFI